jgi:hypothetical protein
MIIGLSEYCCETLKNKTLDSTERATVVREAFFSGNSVKPGSLSIM